MPTFPTRSHRSPSTLLLQIRRHPFVLFGLPFLSLVVASSYALQSFTQTRYDLHGQKVRTMTQEEALGMDKARKRIDIREEYYRLNAIPSSTSDSSLDASSSSSSSISLDPSNPGGTKKKSKFSLAAVAQNEYEPVRVPRPAGMPEWGSGDGGEEAPLKGRRKEDRWV